MATSTLPLSLEDSSILIVDDESGIRDFLSRALVKNYKYVETASSTEEADASLGRANFDLLVVDICMPGRTGVEWIKELRSQGLDCEVVFMSAFANMNDAIEVLRVGASDLILKPFRIEQMKNAISRSLNTRKLSRENYVLKRSLGWDKSSGIIGESDSIQDVKSLVNRVAKISSPVLLEGETGTGKELFAKSIHDLSERKGPFVPLNCGAISPELMESELFGHTKGAFTGAESSRLGLFAYADSGTLFLDEIAEMPLALQSKLLRILEDGRVRPVGTDVEHPVNVRVIAATNRNLEECVHKGLFREDLFYRLNVMQINLPPLRQRAGDVELLANIFSRNISAELGETEIKFSREDLVSMNAHYWPGNIRELKNLIEKCVLLRQQPSSLLMKASTQNRSEGYPANWSLEKVEKAHSLKVLETFKGNKSQTADVLGVTRKTLDKKLE